MKQGAVSSTDHGGGKRRCGIKNALVISFIGAASFCFRLPNWGKINQRCRLMRLRRRRKGEACGAMPVNAVLLLGAGFSKNWNGLIASQISSDLMSRLQTDAQLIAMLNRLNFEDALTEVQREYLHRRTAESEQRLVLLQNALSNMFDRMNRQFQSQPFEFSNDVSRSLQKFLVRFDAIFTLNQDMLLEIHYRNENVVIWHGTRWQGWEMPGLRPLPLADPMDRAAAKWRPEEPFRSNANMQPYYKLHGSTGWETIDGQRLLVVGRDKTGTIARHPILHWTYQRFEECVRRRPTRVMIIGYGFGDDHINQTLIDAHQTGTLVLIYLVHPRGRAILNKYPSGLIPGPQPLLDIPCIECTVPISVAFSADDMAREHMERIFA